MILFARSHFSIGERTLYSRDIFNEADKHGYQAACLMDTMNISGMIAFSRAAKQVDIKPLIG
ncbi:PHP domain-containing protein, partial [Pseudoalteromonas sp. SIMBA_162]|uniref:PHP domain-containing protein n=1 Tax=Pseudoalteromonas sp. SIMBA_162 TaxID=3080867 RepID=UPI00397D9F78